MADKEQAIKKIMEASGVSRVDAEFIYSLEAEEASGDLVEVESEKPSADGREDPE